MFIIDVNQKWSSGRQVAGMKKNRANNENGKPTLEVRLASPLEGDWYYY